jgi:hypothetical protein
MMETATTSKDLLLFLLQPAYFLLQFVYLRLLDFDLALLGLDRRYGIRDIID